MKALAQRYANALVDVALEHNQAAQIKQELAAFAALIRESADLRAFLASPAITRANKHAVLDQLAHQLRAAEFAGGA